MRIDTSDYFPWQSWSPPNKNSRGPVIYYCPVKEIAPENKKPTNFRKKGKITGWCSWYALGGTINESNLLEQAEKIKEKHLDCQYFLIDDGWCVWGDWMMPERLKFPHGFKDLTVKIKSKGFKIGLWMAPFLVSPKSQIYKRHHDWLVRDKKGNLVEGLKFTLFDRYLPWNKYILDFSQKEARNYIINCIDYVVRSYRVSLLKLDFLYAPYFDPKLSDDRPPHRYLTELFDHIRNKFPEVYLMVSGCPYKPARYLAHSIRVSQDNAVPWLYSIPLVRKYIHSKRLSYLEKNMSLLKKHAKYFNSDPDVYFEKAKIGLTQRQLGKLKNIVFSSKVCFSGEKYS